MDEQERNERRSKMSATEMLAEIQQADTELTNRYAAKLVVNAALDRKLVSFQANKEESGIAGFGTRKGFPSR